MSGARWTSSSSRAIASSRSGVERPGQRASQAAGRRGTRVGPASWRRMDIPCALPSQRLPSPLLRGVADRSSHLRPWPGIASRGVSRNCVKEPGAGLKPADPTAGPPGGKKRAPPPGGESPGAPRVPAPWSGRSPRLRREQGRIHSFRGEGSGTGSCHCGLRPATTRARRRGSRLRGGASGPSRWTRRSRTRPPGRRCLRFRRSAPRRRMPWG